ncbi:hypothetical protein DXG01_003398, partial [Tephrocybe rancida]
MYTSMVGIHKGQSRNHQQVLASKAMLHVTLKKRSSSSSCDTYTDLDVHTWAKTDISYAIFRRFMGLKDDIVDAFLQSQEAQFAHPGYDVLHGLYLVTFIDDDQPSDTRPYASVVRGFVCNAVRKGSSHAWGPCGVGLPPGLSVGHIELMLAAHAADKIVKHATKAAKRTKLNACVAAHV